MNQSAHSFDDQIVIPSLQQQLCLFDMPAEENGVYFNAPEIDLASYDHIILAHSGSGKDSLACMLHLLDSGVEPSCIQLWHQLVDGSEGSDLMDWPFIDDYLRQIGEAYNLPVYRSWIEGPYLRMTWLLTCV